MSGVVHDGGQGALASGTVPTYDAVARGDLPSGGPEAGQGRRPASGGARRGAQLCPRQGRVALVLVALDFSLQGWLCGSRERSGSKRSGPNCAAEPPGSRGYSGGPRAALSTPPSVWQADPKAATARTPAAARPDGHTHAADLKNQWIQTFAHPPVGCSGSMPETHEGLNCKSRVGPLSLRRRTAQLLKARSVTARAAPSTMQTVERERVGVRQVCSRKPKSPAHCIDPVPHSCSERVATRALSVPPSLRSKRSLRRAPPIVLNLILIRSYPSQPPGRSRFVWDRRRPGLQGRPCASLKTLSTCGTVLASGRAQPVAGPTRSPTSSQRRWRAAIHEPSRSSRDLLPSTVRATASLDRMKRHDSALPKYSSDPRLLSPGSYQ